MMTTIQGLHGTIKMQDQQIKQLTEDLNQAKMNYSETYRHESELLVENARLRAALELAAEQIRKCDYTPARSTLLEALKGQP